MGGVTGETNGIAFEKETVNGEPNKEFVLGEILWVKLHEASWWPAQIVDENSVSSANKPTSKGSSSDVLVRLYGSCIFKYVDAHCSHAEFKKILIENNFNYDDILKKSLEKDLPSLTSSKSRKRQQSKSKGSKDLSNKSQTKVSSKKQKQGKSKTCDSHPQTSDGSHHGSEPTTPNKGLSARRMKVMQNLGLVAPSGSPFPRGPTLSN